MVKFKEIFESSLENKYLKIIKKDPEYYSGEAFSDMVKAIAEVTGKKPKIKYNMDYESMDDMGEGFGYVISDNIVSVGSKKIRFEGSYSAGTEYDAPQGPESQGLGGSVTAKGIDIQVEDDWIEEEDMEIIKDYFRK